MAEALIYTRLSEYTALTDLVGQSVYPTTPTENTPLPFVVYTVSGSTPQTHLSGSSGLTQYTVDIDAYAINLDDVLAILTQTRAALHLWRELPVQGSFLTNQQTQQEDECHHGHQSYSVWA